MSGYFKSKCASWERFLSPTCKWQSRHSYLLSAWLSHCVISGSVLLTFRRVIVHRVGVCLAPRLSTSACVFSFMSDVRAHPAAAPFWVHLFIKTCFPLHLSVWVRPSDHSALCFQLLHASTLACIMDLPVTSHKHPKGTTLTIPTVSFPQCRFIDTGLLISLSWSCCFFYFSVSNELHGIWSHHFMENYMGKQGNNVRLYFGGLQNHCRWWLQPWN